MSAVSLSMTGTNAALTALSLVPLLPREALATLVEHAIDRLDEMDPDPDLEPNGDELDGGNAEDDFGERGNWLLGPGCPIADPDSVVDV